MEQTPTSLCVRGKHTYTPILYGRGITPRFKIESLGLSLYMPLGFGIYCRTASDIEPISGTRPSTSGRSGNIRESVLYPVCIAHPRSVSVTDCGQRQAVLLDPRNQGHWLGWDTERPDLTILLVALSLPIVPYPLHLPTPSPTSWLSLISEVVDPPRYRVESTRSRLEWLELPRL